MLKLMFIQILRYMHVDLLYGRVLESKFPAFVPVFIPVNVPVFVPVSVPVRLFPVGDYCTCTY